MNNCSNGKIARLPHHIREQIHLRLRDGQRAKPILAWLNSIPEVREVLASSYGGRPIDDGNLSEWKKRSHRLWLVEQAALAEASRFMAECRQLAQAGEGTITDNLNIFVAAQYALATQQSGGEADPEAAWKRLRALCHDVVELRRGDQLAERLRLQRETLALRHPKTSAQSAQ
jgi:hypothetical protein